jgi:NDP-sugar pyrophosphorylase family protein
MSAFSAIVLAGGLGTRLRSTFLAGPKSMARVANRPFLEYMLAKLRVCGITDVVICVGYNRSQIRSYFRKGTKWGLQVRYSVEEQLLGTAGALKRAAEMVDAPSIFVFSGDTFIDLDVKGMWEFHYHSKALATVAVIGTSRASRPYQLVLDEHNAVAAICASNGSLENAQGTRFASAGVYLVSREFIDQVPPDRPVSIDKDMLPRIMGLGLYGFPTNGYFLDIGMPEGLARAQKELPSRWMA